MKAPVLAVLVIGATACVGHSTAVDVSTVRGLVRERAALDLPARSAQELGSEDPPDIDPDVRALVSRPLTVDNAIRIALLNNRDLHADLLGLGVARGQLVQASLFPNPEFEAAVRSSQDPAQDLQWDFGLGIDLTQIILIGQRQSVADAELDAARLRAAAATLDLGYQVRLAYYEVQASAQQLELMQTSLQAFAASYETTQALHEAGNVTDLDLANEQAAYEGARVAVTESEVDVIEARERLNVLLGFFGRDTTWQIEPRLADPPATLGDLQHLEGRAIEASLELSEFRATLTAAARRVGLTETTGWLPDVTLALHAEHDGSYWELGPALTGRLPVFDRQQGNVQSRQAEFDALRERYVAQAIGIRAGVRVARARALSAEARVRQYRDTLLPLRERVVRETVLQYNAMAVGVFQVLQARRDQIETGRMYVATLLDYWRARAALEQLLAGRFADTIGVARNATSQARTGTQAQRTH